MVDRGFYTKNNKTYCVKCKSLLSSNKDSKLLGIVRKRYTREMIFSCRKCENLFTKIVFEDRRQNEENDMFVSDFD